MKITLNDGNIFIEFDDHDEAVDFSADLVHAIAAPGTGIVSPLLSADGVAELTVLVAPA